MSRIGFKPKRLGTRVATRTRNRFPPDVGVAGFAGGHDCAFDPDDPVARFPRAGDRQGGSRRTPAARLWPEAPRRPADTMAGSMARAWTQEASAGVRNDSPLLFFFGEEANHPIRTSSDCRGLKPKGHANSRAGARGKQQPWKRNFAARDFRPDAPPIGRRDAGIGLADRLPTPQAAEMSCYSTVREITSICTDFLVERRGFELMAIAALRLRIEEFRW
jgi:hypothetical protein